MYRVVYPLGRRTQQLKPRTARRATLEGVTIGELSNHKFDAGFTFEALEKALLKRYPNLKFVSYRQFGDVYGSHESDVIKALPGKLKEYECDLVISGNAG